MHVVFIQIYFPVGTIHYCSISETITSTSVDYVTMFSFLQGSIRNFYYLTAGRLCFLWLENIARTGKKDGLRELLGGGGGMAKNISS